MSDSAAPGRLGWLRSRRPPGSAVSIAVLAAASLVPPFLLSSQNLQLVIVALIWCMATYGLYIPYGLAGAMTAAIGAVWGVGAFVAALASADWGWSFLPCVGLAMVGAAIAAVVMALPMLRTKGQYFVILTFVLASAVTVAAGNWSVTSGPFEGGISVPSMIGIGSWQATGLVSSYWVCAIVVAVMLTAVVLIRRSHFGRLLISISQNEELARSIGVPTIHLKLLAMGIGGLFAGAGGAFYAFYLHQVEIANFGFNTAITIILMLVLGGVGSPAAPIIGSIAVYFIPQLIGLNPIQQQIVYGAVLALLIIVAPQGLGSLPAKLRRRRAGPGAPTKVASDAQMTSNR